MPLCFSLEQMARFREAARVLALEAGEQEAELKQLLATIEHDLVALRLAVPDPPKLTQSLIDTLMIALSEQNLRSTVSVMVLRQLWQDAREHYLAAERLVSDLGDRQAEPMSAPRRLAVLVVDDYPASREWLSRVLDHAGYLVGTAANGIEAVVVAHQLRPAVIMMDLAMPVLDGVEATRLIKAIDELRHSPVIAFTARTPLDRPVYRELFAAVIQKPSPPTEIVATVHRYANARH